jgi:nitroreductase
MSLVLAAHALSYGANWITEWYAYDRGVLDAIGLHERIAGFIHIGRPPGPREDRPRPPLNEIAAALQIRSEITTGLPASCDTGCRP